MELTRRDALAALGMSGAVAGGAALTWDRHRATPDAGVGDGKPLGPDVAETLVALAETLYPSAVTGVDEFVETYVVGRVRNRPAYAGGVAEAAETLDSYATDWEGRRFAALNPEARDSLLREIGVETAEPDPDGYAPGRIRRYLVNELLYALYASPKGGELVGIENPKGHPGGVGSYRRGPRS